VHESVIEVNEWHIWGLNLKDRFIHVLTVMSSSLQDFLCPHFDLDQSYARINFSSMKLLLTAIL